MWKNPSSCDCTVIRTHTPTSKGVEVNNGTTGATGRTFKSAVIDAAAADTDPIALMFYVNGPGREIEWGGFFAIPV